MTTLRVLIDGAPARGRAQAWALFDDAGACVRTGRDPPDAWPPADRVEAVLAASLVRIASVALPPLAPARVAAAAAFAVDDQLAGPQEAQHLAVSTQQPGGRVRVVIASRALIATLRERHANAGAHARVTRIIAEPDLAIPDNGWRWCGAGRGDGFVRRTDGSAFPVSPTVQDDGLPPELSLALAHARRDSKAPAEVRVERDATDAELSRWQRESGVSFVRGGAWRWFDAPAAAFAGAIDLLQGDFALTSPPAAGARPRLFVPALTIAAVALTLHVVLSVVEWGTLKLDTWRQSREWATLATSAGVAAEAAPTPSAAQAAIAKRYAELRHSQGMLGPDDALPLLARAAQALRTLPAGSVKGAAYAGGHWTIDLSRADPAAIAEIDARLKEARVPALIATSAAGARIRLGAL
jgi:type II secretion system protein L